jgi:hypothetical protein
VDDQVLILPGMLKNAQKSGSVKEELDFFL